MLCDFVFPSVTHFLHFSFPHTHLDNRKPCHQRFLNPRKCMLSSLISHYILLMFLNQQCHSLRIRIMKLVKADLALSPGGFVSSLQFVLWMQRKVLMGGTQEPVSIFCSLICKCMCCMIIGHKIGTAKNKTISSDLLYSSLNLFHSLWKLVIECLTEF